MTQLPKPTHTHRESGGRYGQVTTYWGVGPLEGQQFVVYQDLDRVTESLTTMDDWATNWQAIEPDDCPVCLGTGHDQIKGNKDKPCGGCYGLGKVLVNGERPADLWELATVATGIIERQQAELHQLRQIANNPAVQGLLDQQRQQVITDSVGRQYQEWSDGHGHGPGGQRYTGD
jgi:hypothetical protein